MQRNLSDGKDKRFQLSFLMYSDHKAKCVSVLFAEWSAPFLHEASVLPAFHISASNADSVLLPVWISHTCFSLESFLSCSVPGAMNWQHNPEAEVLKLILYSLFSNWSHREQHRKLRDLKSTLSGKRGNWGSNSYIRTTHPAWGPAFGAAWWNHAGEIHISACKLKYEYFCPSLPSKTQMKLSWVLKSGWILYSPFPK